MVWEPVKKVENYCLVPEAVLSNIRERNIQ